MSKNDALSAWASKYKEENNLVIHSIRMSQSHDQKRDRLVKLLSKIQGLPAQQSHILLELQVTYNCVLLQRVTADQQCPREVMVQETHLITKVLNRVCQLHKSMGSTEHSEISPLLGTTWELLRQQPQAKAALVWLICLHTVHLLKFGQPQMALLLLQKLSELPTREINNPHEWSADIYLVSGIFPTQTKPDMGEAFSLIYLLRAMASHLCGKSGESLSLLGKCSAECYQVPCQVLKAHILQSQGSYEQCLEVLEEVRLQSSAELDIWQQAYVTMLSGVCYGKQGCHHSAIECYEEALKQNSSCLMPLYHIAEAYKSLEMPEAEIEALTLLVKFSQRTPSRVPHRDLSSPGHQLLQDLCVQDISYPRALYTLAKRYMELQRFSESSTHYLKLLAWLQSPESYNDGNKNIGVSAENKIPSSQSIPALPEMQTLFHEAALALLRADKHDEAIVICDHAIRSYSKTPTPQHSGLTDEDIMGLNDDNLEDISNSKKRHRSDSLLLSSQNDPQFCEDLVALRYKSLALCKSQQLEEALGNLNLLTSSTEKQLMEENTCLEPQRKRIKLASVSDESKDTESPASATSLAHAYSCKAHVQWKLGKKKDAFHNSRISLQLAPEDALVEYNHCLMLHYNGRRRDAQETWGRTKKKNIDMKEMEGSSAGEPELSPMWEQWDAHGAAILDKILQKDNS